MIIHKETIGTVVQAFDTETRLFVSQHFVASDKRSWTIENGRQLHMWANDGDAEMVYGKGGVDEPYLNFDMKDPVYRRGPHNDKPPTHRFKVGDSVMVVPKTSDGACMTEFDGTVCGFKGSLIQVKDQDDNVFDCDPEEVKPGFEA